ACGMAAVRKPLPETSRATCHQWLVIGRNASGILPMIWVYMCSVSYVGSQSVTGRAGQRCHSLVISAPSVSASVAVGYEPIQPATDPIMHQREGPRRVVGPHGPRRTGRRQEP